METEYILAVDIGGTKTAAAVVDGNGAILVRREEPTCQDGPRHGVAQIINLLDALIHEFKMPKSAWLGIGIGIPAVLEPETDFVIWGPNLKGWRNVDLSGSLHQHFNLPVAIEYDGHTAALGEWWVGAGKNYHSFVDIIIGTGIGGGMVLDGKLFRGENRLAGAAGWFVLSNGDEPDFKASSRDHLGYWEMKAAGIGLAAIARSLLDQYPESVLTNLPASQALDAKRIFSAYDANDPLAIRVLEDLAIVLGRGIANIISLMNPEAVILGGGIGTHCEILLPRINAEIARWAQPISVQSARLLISNLGSDAGILGAAYGALLRINSN